MSISMATRRTITAEPPTGVARIAVERDAVGRLRWSALDAGRTIAPRPVWAAEGQARVALVGISMMMLAGDDVRIDVTVGAGVTLELVEPAALVAHRADGRPCSWSMRVAVREGGSFLYQGAPLIAADGASIDRAMEVDLASDARALLRETLVLGRVGERGGEIRSTTRLRDDEGEVLTERLDAGTDASRLPGILGASRVVDSVIAVGWRPLAVRADPTTTSLELEGPGRVVRGLASDTSTLGIAMSSVYDSWRRELVEGSLGT
jgi:urease accessory protein